MSHPPAILIAMHVKRIHRLLGVLAELVKSPAIRRSDLASAFGVTERQVYRDLEALRDAGLIVRTPLGYVPAPEIQPPSASMTPGELASLELGVAGLGSSPSSLPHTRAHAALGKLRAVAPLGVRETAGSESLVRRLVPPTAEAAVRPVEAVIEDACRRHERLRMRYHTPSRELVTERLIDPYTIFSRGSAWYLVGYCYRAGAFRTFKLARVQGVAGTGETFDPRPEFSLEEYLRPCWRVWRGRPQQVRIRFSGEAARRIRETEHHPTQRIREVPGGVELRAEAGGLPEIASWVLGFGPDAEVLAPPALRRLVAERAAQTAARYGLGPPVRAVQKEGRDRLRPRRRPSATPALDLTAFS